MSQTRFIYTYTLCKPRVPDGPCLVSISSGKKVLEIIVIYMYIAPG